MQDYNIKSIRQEFKEKGVFYTQKELALYLKSFLPDDVTEIYEKNVFTLLKNKGDGM